MAPTKDASLSPRAAAFCRCVVLVLHVAYGATFAYESNQYFTLGLLEEGLENQYYRLIGLGSGTYHSINLALAGTSVVIALWHLVGLARAVRASVKHCRLLLDVPDEQIVHRFKTKLPNLATNANLAGAPRSKATKSVARAFMDSGVAKLRHVWRDYFTMAGQHFETGTNVRETIEILTQFNTLSRMSRAVAERQINQLVVSVFVLNCFSTPLLRLLFRHSDPFVSRVARHVMSMLLASCFTVALPAMIWRFAMPLVAPSILFNQVTTTRTRLLLMHVMIKQWTQVLSTRAAACMAILAMETLKKKLSVSSRDIASVVAVTEQLKDESEDDDDGTSRRPTRRRRCMKVSLLFDAVWLAIGVAVVGIHVSANRAPSAPPGVKCDMPMHPWFSTQFPCAIVEFNCHRAQVIGLAEEIEAFIDAIDISMVSTLRFTHCGALTMPRKLQEFSNLASIEIYNASIAAWPAKSALSQKHHPYLGSIWLVHVTNMASLPPGLLARDFPAIDVLMAFTDLAQLPENLGDCWPPVMTKLAFEYSQLTAFPPALKQVTGLALSLAGNKIANIDESDLKGKQFVHLTVSDNPGLSALPDTGWSSPSVQVWGTNISSPPLWMTTPPATAFGLFYAGGTRVCAPYAVGQFVPLASGVMLNCAPASSSPGLFPIAQIAPQRTL